MSTSAPGPPDPTALSTRMHDAGETAVVVVPALDEQDTVGDVVGRLRRDLVDGAGLVEEIVVVDGGSSDGTPVRAAGAGARVVDQLAAADGVRGKGAALQVGVAASTASLVVFVDADVLELDTSYVTRLLAPLVEDERVLLTKAAYERPLGTAGTATGGGRVTELMARPLLATFWPELSDLAQPLAGEYAGRRSLLRSLPFVAGYGVEIALLLDTLDAHGRDAIHQVPLGPRAHTHQSLRSLGRMAAEILQVALARADAQGRGPVAAPVLRQPVRDGAGYAFEDHPVSWAERPPLAG